MMQLKIVSVPVADQERSKLFYRDVLGFSVILEAPFDGGAKWVQMLPPAGSTSISLVTWFKAMPAGSVRGLVLETLDLENMHQKLSARGLAIDPIETAPWGSYATFKDPDGNGWILMSPTMG